MSVGPRFTRHNSTPADIQTRVDQSLKTQVPGQTLLPGSGRLSHERDSAFHWGEREVPEHVPDQIKGLGDMLQSHDAENMGDHLDMHAGGNIPAHLYREPHFAPLESGQASATHTRNFGNGPDIIHVRTDLEPDHTYGVVAHELGHHVDPVNQVQGRRETAAEKSRAEGFAEGHADRMWGGEVHPAGTVYELYEGSDPLLGRQHGAALPNTWDHAEYYKARDAARDHGLRYTGETPGQMHLHEDNPDWRRMAVAGNHLREEAAIAQRRGGTGLMKTEYANSARSDMRRKFGYANREGADVLPPGNRTPLQAAAFRMLHYVHTPADRDFVDAVDKNEGDGSTNWAGQPKSLHGRLTEISGTKWNGLT